MSFKIGSTAIGEIYVGSQKIKEAYVGSTLVYQLSSPGPGPGPQPGSFGFTPSTASVAFGANNWGQDTPTLFTAIAPSSEAVTITLDCSGVPNPWWSSSTRLCLLENGVVFDHFEIQTNNSGGWLNSSITVNVTAGRTYTVKGIWNELTGSTSFNFTGTLGISPIA
jgi:hypothetical protein